jgi:hypothetical protein
VPSTNAPASGSSPRQAQYSGDSPRIGYESIVGQLWLTQVTAGKVDMFLTEKEEALSAKTLNHLRGYLRRAFTNGATDRNSRDLTRSRTCRSARW